MLNKAKTLERFKLKSLDGEIGKVKDFYFDDRYWAIRYLVADTGHWLKGRQVLISPYALAAVMKDEQDIAIHLTKQQIEDSPSLDSDKPVSRQFEDAYYGFYGWPMYWAGPYMWGANPYSVRPYLARDIAKGKEPTQSKSQWDPHLRSAVDVSGYHIQAVDGEIGHVADFIIDDETWAIRYLIIDTRNWWPGQKLLLSPQWIQRVSWDDAKVFVNLTREAIKQSPQYTEQSLVTRDYEASLHRHYNRQGYWVDESAPTRRSL